MAWYSTLKQVSLLKIKHFFDVIRSKFQIIIQWFIAKQVIMPKPVSPSEPNSVEDLSIDPKSKFFNSALEHGDIDTVKKTLDLALKTQVLAPDDFLKSELYNLGIYQKYAIRRFALPDTQHTPISYALSFNQTKMVQFLLETAYAKLSDEQYQKVLNETFIYACQYENLTIMEVCLQKLPSSPNPIENTAFSSSGLNVFQSAAYMGKISSIKCLLEHNANINHKNDDNPHSFLAHCKSRTPLCFALSSKVDAKAKSEIVLFLLNSGAKLDFYALEMIVKTNFIIDFDSLYQPIEFMEDPKNEYASYKEILTKVNEHNKKLKKNTIELIEQAFDQKIPKVLPPIIYDYLSLKCSVNAPSTSQEVEVRLLKPSY